LNTWNRNRPLRWSWSLTPPQAQAVINARTSTVWDIITDADNYTVWDSGITHIDGEMRDGSVVRIRTLSGGNRSFRLRVEQTPGEAMSWTWRLPLGLFKAVRTFTLIPESGMTHLSVRDDFTGPLSGLLSRNSSDRDRALSDYVSAVKHRAEIMG
jgi:hypothetical protein